MSQTLQAPKVPPHDLEAEASVIGAILLDSTAITRVLELLEPEDFYRENGGQIYKAAISLFREGEPIDHITLSAELEKRGILERVGGRAHLALLQEQTPTAANVEYYAQIVKDRAYKRRLITAGTNVTALGYDETLDADEAVNQAQAQVFEISDYQRKGSNFERLYDLLRPAMDRIDSQMAGGGGVVGTASGFTDVDRLTNGFKPSDLVVVAGRPSMGKTSFALNIALNAAIEQRLPVAIFSLEMSKEQLVERMLCEQAQIDAQRLHRGMLSEAEHERLVYALGPLGDAPIYIDDSPMLDDLTLRLKARQAKAREGIQMIVLDYLQLMQGRRPGDDANRVQEVSNISRSLKGIARELKVPMLAISQLSRAPESRPDKRPILSDLRESGCMPASTQLLRADTGEAVTLGKLVLSQEQPLVWSLDDSWRLVPRRLLKTFPSGIKRVYRLRLASGCEVQATANHPFRTVESWTRLDNLKPGDHIAVPRRLPPPKAIKGWDEDELILLAHFLGDGSMGPMSVKYATSDSANRQIVMEAAQRRFDIEVKGEKLGNTWQLWFPSPYRLTHNRYHPIRIWLEPLGLWGRRAADKFIPEVIHSLSDEQIACFLRHLWATDGSITLGRNPRGRMVSVYYSSISRSLIEGVRRLLLRLDIRSRVKRSRKSGYADNWQVWITGAENIQRFLSTVGCHGARGEVIADAEQIVTGLRPNPNVDLVPVAVAKEVRSAVAVTGGTHRGLAIHLGERYCGSYLLGSPSRPRRFSRHRLAKMAEFAKSKSLSDLAVSDVFWDEVVEITELGDMPTFDATIEGTHNFIADGVIAHNSIEQDADMVMFLYRDEYYSREKSEKPGIAEVIVAKHRNGPTGVAELLFRKELTRFENLDRRHSKRESSSED